MSERQTLSELKRRKLKIGIDIDDVVVDHFKHVLSAFNERFGTHLTLEDITSFHYLETLDPDNIEMGVFLERQYGHPSTLFEGVTPVLGSQEIINRFKSEGHDIHFISSRERKLKRRTLDWLKQFGFPVTNRNLHLKSTSSLNGVEFKIQKTQELGIDIMIEDDSRVAKELDITVILIDHAWNRDVEKKDRIIRVDGWEQIHGSVENITKNP